MFANLRTDMRTILNFKEILECSILEDGATIQSSGTGRAIVGGVIGGGVGAIVGASTQKSTPEVLSLSIRVVTSNISNALYEIPIISSPMNRTSIECIKLRRFAQEIYATLTSIIEYNKSIS